MHRWLTPGSPLRAGGTVPAGDRRFRTIDAFVWHPIPAESLGREGRSVLLGESLEVENQWDGPTKRRSDRESEMSEPGRRGFYLALFATALVTIAVIGFLIWAFANHHVVNGHAA